MLVAHRRHSLRIFHRHRLPAAGVIRHRQHHQRNAFAPHLANQLLQRRDIHVALERKHRLRLPRLGNLQIDRLAPTNSTLARVVSKCVLFGTTSPFLHITLNRMRSAARPW
jgi:hypothetical protein